MSVWGWNGGYLEGLAGAGTPLKDGQGVSGFKVAADGKLPGLRKGVAHPLEPPAKARRTE